MTDAGDLAAKLRTDYASLLPPAPRARPDVDRALDEARERLGTVQARRRDGTPREQTALDLRG